MTNITEQQKEVAEQYRKSISKTSLIALYSIYDSHNGTSHQGCWCGALTRKKKHTALYTWFDSEK